MILKLCAAARCLIIAISCSSGSGWPYRNPCPTTADLLERLGLRRRFDTDRDRDTFQVMRQMNQCLADIAICGLAVAMRDVFRTELELGDGQILQR